MKSEKNQKIKSEKKAQGHIEVILSMVLFVGVLIVLLVFINPFSKIKQDTSIIDNAQKVFLDRVSKEIGKLPIISNEDSGGYYYDLDINDYTDYYTEVIEVTRARKTKYTIYFSDEDIFDNALNNRQAGYNTGNFRLGAYAKEEIIIEQKVADLINDPDSLSIRNSFSFSFKEINGINELRLDREPPKGINVESKEFPVRIINNQGEIKDYIFNLRVW